MTQQPVLAANTWLDSLALFALDNGFVDFGLVDVGRHSDDEDVPSACIILTVVRGVVAANMGFGNDVLAPYLNLYVRGLPDAYLEPRNACWDLWAALLRIGARTVRGTEFLWVGGESPPTPNPLGWDDQRRSQWSVDIPLWMRQPAVAPPTFVP